MKEELRIKLEATVAKFLLKYAIRIQACYRGYVARLDYQYKLLCIDMIQRNIRVALFRKHKK